MRRRARSSTCGLVGPLSLRRRLPVSHNMCSRELRSQQTSQEHHHSKHRRTHTHTRHTLNNEVYPASSVVKCVCGVFVWGFGVLFLSCVYVSGVLFYVDVCDLLIFLTRAVLSSRPRLGLPPKPAGDPPQEGRATQGTHQQTKHI